MATTQSNDNIIKALAEGTPASVKCPWQQWHFINYTRVQKDILLSVTDLYKLDWTAIANELTRSSWLVFRKKMVDPSEAMDPTKSLPYGWQYGEVIHSGTTYGVAYFSIPSLPFYHVSVARFMRYL